MQGALAPRLSLQGRNSSLWLSCFTQPLTIPPCPDAPSLSLPPQIALIQFCISPPKSDLENNVIVSDYTQMDRVYKEERNYILGLVKKVKASGCNVLLIQKSILRDAVTDLALHYLVRGLRRR